MESNIEKFKKIFKKNIKSDIGDGQVYFKLGKKYREEGEFAVSIKEFEKNFKNNLDRFPFLKNRLLNEIEISQRKIVLESKPQALNVMLSSKCNINCIMCESREKSWELPMRAINEIVKYFPYFESVQWQGGEVFLLDYFEDLFDEASHFSNLRQVINTNGLLITENWARKIVQNKVDITFSVDGVTKDVYEYIRKGAEFKDLLKGITLINEAKEKYGKIRSLMSSVIMKSNYQQMDLILDFARQYRFDSLVLTRIDGNFDSQENIFHFKDFAAENYIKKMLPEISKRARDFGIELINCLYPNSDFKPSVCSSRDPDISKDSIFTRKDAVICYLPWRELTIDFVGVRPDCRCPVAAGNIFDSSLIDIWNNEVMQRYRKKLLTRDYMNFCRPECSSGVVAEKFLKDII